MDLRRDTIPELELCAPQGYEFFAKFKDPRFWADVAMSLICFGPLNIIIWRGAWDFQVLYIIPGDDYTGSWISLVVGGFLWACICLINPYLNKYAVFENLILSYLSKQLYNFITTWVLLFYWRGGWSLLDYAGGWGAENWENNAYLLIISVVLGLITRTSFWMIGGAPLYVSLDFKNFYSQTPGLFGQTIEHKRWKYITGVLFVNWFIAFLPVIVWRCVWNLLDEFLLPDDYLWSNIWSCVIGNIGQYDNGRSIEFQIDYFQYLLQERNQRRGQKTDDEIETVVSHTSNQSALVDIDL